MPEADARPPVWIGHVSMATPDLPATREFMLALGMRDIAHGSEFAVFELRGGTHLVLLPAETAAPETPAPFDLMVEDLAATHHALTARGLAPSSIVEGRIHDSFTVRSPSGHLVTFNSSHVSDLPV